MKPRFRWEFVSGAEKIEENMSTPEEPVVLELAPLPREQIGPFILLGIEKDAGPAAIESHWARRVVWARKNQINVALQDINWAREVVNDAERRLRADVTSLNVDTMHRILHELAGRFGLDPARLASAAADVPAPREQAAFTPPTSDEWRQQITVPELPWQAPAAEAILADFARQPIDPWRIPGIDTKAPAKETPR